MEDARENDLSMAENLQMTQTHLPMSSDFQNHTVSTGCHMSMHNAL